MEIIGTPEAKKEIVRTEYADEVYGALKRVQEAYRVVWFERARILKEIKEKKIYRYISGLGYQSWDEFCSDPVIGMSRVTANLHIDLYTYFIEGLKLTEEDLANIPIGRLQRMLPIIDKLDTEEKGNILAEAKLLSDKDFYKNLNERTGTQVLTRPSLYFDAGMQKWVFKFHPSIMGKIIDESEDKVIWENS